MGLGDAEFRVFCHIAVLLSRFCLKFLIEIKIKLRLKSNNNVREVKLVVRIENLFFTFLRF